MLWGLDTAYFLGIFCLRDQLLGYPSVCQAVSAWSRGHCCVQGSYKCSAGVLLPTWEAGRSGLCPRGRALKAPRGAWEGSRPLGE